MSNNKYYRRAGFLALLGVSTAAVLSGCGGATTNSGVAGSVATPTVYGVNVATGAAGSGIQFPSADGKTTLGGIVGAISSTATALEGTVALGFPASAFGADGQTAGQAVPASQPSVIFGALIANGNLSNASGAITGATLTSPEVPSFTQPLSFTGVGTGPIGSAGYTSPAFTLPFTTSGIHQFTVKVTDEGNQTSTTTLGVVVLAPTDSGIFASITPSAPSTVPAKTTATVVSATATITNPVTAATAQPTPDAQGNVILFAAPGPQTVSVTAQVQLKLPDGTMQTVTETGTDTETLVAGQILASLTTTTPGPPVTTATNPYTITIAVPGTTGSIAKPHLIKRH